MSTLRVASNRLAHFVPPSERCAMVLFFYLIARAGCAFAEETGTGSQASGREPQDRNPAPGAAHRERAALPWSTPFGGSSQAFSLPELAPKFQLLAAAIPGIGSGPCATGVAQRGVREDSGAARFERVGSPRGLQDARWHPFVDALGFEIRISVAADRPRRYPLAAVDQPWFRQRRGVGGDARGTRPTVSDGHRSLGWFETCAAAGAFGRRGPPDRQTRQLSSVMSVSLPGAGAASPSHRDWRASARRTPARARVRSFHQPGSRRCASYRSCCCKQSGSRR